MKRLLVVLLLLCISVSASAENELRGWNKEEGYVYVSFGSFPQSIDGGKPEEDGNTWKWAHDTIENAAELDVKPTPILWRVLSVDEGNPYLCSEYVLFAAPTHVNVTEYKTIGKNFAETDLGILLNTVFLEKAFTAEEREMILETESFGRISVPASNELSTRSDRAKTIGFRPTDEFKFNGNKALGTEYAIRTDCTFKVWADERAEKEGKSEEWAEKYRKDHDKAFSYVVKPKYGAHSLYWTRDQSSTDIRHAGSTKDGGQLGHIIANRMNLGVRPVLYLDPAGYVIDAGTGTKEDPYILIPSAK